ncbi:MULTISPECIES: cytochrome ubiquinol oxidase subunit I [Nocardia]|uniref:cytochrome ubiquinol oxidase subunit I n=1 Tax=Nocardia TaxID=1817 RepID=UPI001E3F1816|nr:MULTISPECIES: cytochrome ubiquinol oxidase subunit I [Nocardia]
MTAPVPGLDSVPVEDRPPINITHLAFQTMGRCPDRERTWAVSLSDPSLSRPVQAKRPCSAPDP